MGKAGSGIVIMVLALSFGGVGRAAAAPATCAEAHVADPAAADGTFSLTRSGSRVSIYCADMAGTPKEYLTLPQGPSVNFGQYAAGGASPGTTVQTGFEKVRLDLDTYIVDVGDLRFASSSGSLQHSSVTRGPTSPFVTSMPYAVAMGCAAGGRPNAVAKIDLRGTPFAVTDAFPASGFVAFGAATFSQNDQVVDIAGGGYCGAVGPDPAVVTKFNPSPGLAYLSLTPRFGAPAVELTAPFDGAVYAQKERVRAAYTCLPGLGQPLAAQGGCVAPVANGATIDTSKAGTRKFAVTATGADGQTSSQTVQYTVSASLSPQSGQSRGQGTCVSRRVVKVHIKRPRGVRSARVKLGSKNLAAKLTKRRIVFTVDFHGYPAGRFLVRVTGKRADGSAVRIKRTYGTCRRRA